MGMFSKATSSDPNRRVADEPLDGNYGRTLPLLQRVFIRVLVSEIRKMLDERDVEREARDRPQAEGHWETETVLGEHGQPDETRAYWSPAEPRYRARTEQDG